MQEQLNSFHLSTWKVVYYYYLKNDTKWFGINNFDGPFFTLLCIGHMTAGSVIRRICNIPTLLHNVKKTGHFVMWVAFSSSFEVNWTSHMLVGFSLLIGMGAIPPLVKKLCHNTKNSIPLHLHHFYFNFIFFVHTGQVNFDFNWYSTLTECCFWPWKRFKWSKLLLLRFPSSYKLNSPAKFPIFLQWRGILPPLF